MHDVKADKFKSNPIAKRYKATLEHRALDRQARSFAEKGAGVPKNMRRDAIKKAKNK